MRWESIFSTKRMYTYYIVCCVYNEHTLNERGVNTKSDTKCVRDSERQVGLATNCLYIFWCFWVWIKYILHTHFGQKAKKLTKKSHRFSYNMHIISKYKHWKLRAFQLRASHVCGWLLRFGIFKESYGMFIFIISSISILNRYPYSNNTRRQWRRHSVQSIVYTHNPFNNKISTKWKFPPRKHINIPSTL